MAYIVNNTKDIPKKIAEHTHKKTSMKYFSVLSLKMPTTQKSEANNKKRQKQMLLRVTM